MYDHKIFYIRQNERVVFVENVQLDVYRLVAIPICHEKGEG